MNWQLWLAVLAALSLGGGIGAFAGYWRAEWIHQNRQWREFDWLKWRNDELEGLLDRMLDRQFQSQSDSIDFDDNRGSKKVK